MNNSASFSVQLFFVGRNMFADNKFYLLQSIPEWTIFAAKYCRSYAFYYNFDGVCMWFFFFFHQFHHPFCAFIRNIYIFLFWSAPSHSHDNSISIYRHHSIDNHIYTHAHTHTLIVSTVVLSHSYGICYPCQKWKMLIIWTTRFMAQNVYCILNGLVYKDIIKIKWQFFLCVRYSGVENIWFVGGFWSWQKSNHYPLMCTVYETLMPFSNYSPIYFGITFLFASLYLVVLLSVNEFSTFTEFTAFPRKMQRF